MALHLTAFSAPAANVLVQAPPAGKRLRVTKIMITRTSATGADDVNLITSGGKFIIPPFPLGSNGVFIMDDLNEALSVGESIQVSCALVGGGTVRVGVWTEPEV